MRAAFSRSPLGNDRLRAKQPANVLLIDNKIESAKKLLASGMPPKEVAKNLGVSIPTPCQPQHTLSVLCDPFFETTPS